VVIIINGLSVQRTTQVLTEGRPMAADAALSDVVPTMDDVRTARNRIREWLPPTPLHRYSGLDALIGAEVYVKHENYQPVGAFKIRGGLNLISQLPPEERDAGVVTASTGNHGLSIAWASRQTGVQATICVPEGANPGKVAAIRALGARIEEHGPRFDDAAQNAMRLQREQSMRFIHSANEPLLVAGVATLALEMFEQQPDLDYVFTAVGMGSGACGLSLVANAISPRTKVIGVQAEASPAMYNAWKTGDLQPAPNRTFAEGIATGTPAAFTTAIMRELLSDFVLVSDDAIRKAIPWWIEYAHTLAESAAAATLAGVYSRREQLAGRRVGIVCTGGNLAMDQLRDALTAV
jgi:threonine dehydratase